MIGLFIRIASFMTAAGTFMVLLSIAAVYHPGQMILRTYQEIGRLADSGKAGMLDYRKIKNFLNRNGAAFHYGSWMNPVSYMGIRIITGAAGLFIGVFYGMGYGVFMSVLFFQFPGWMLVYLNRRDNEQLLPELKLVYQALAIQIRAGVYVTDALAECYGSVREERLRAALMELSSDIVMKADMDDALERFQGKFDNRYVDSLCITMIQAMESGQAVELLADIAEQIKDMEVVVMNRRKSALDRSLTFYQLGILSAVLGVVLYACIGHMFTAAVMF